MTTGPAPGRRGSLVRCGRSGQPDQVLRPSPASPTLATVQRRATLSILGAPRRPSYRPHRGASRSAAPKRDRAYRQSPGVPIHRVSALAVVWAVHRWQAVRELLRVCPIPLGGSLFILASSSRLIQPLMPVLLSHGASRTHGRIVSNRRRARDVQPTSTTRLTTAAGSSPTSGFSVSTRAHAAAYSSSPGTWGDDEATGYGPDGWSSVRARTYAATLS